MKNRHLWIGALTALGIATSASFAGASSHREAPAISMDPAADNTDVWAWVSKGTHDKLYIVAAYNPLEEPSGQREDRNCENRMSARPRWRATRSGGASQKQDIRSCLD